MAKPKRRASDSALRESMSARLAPVWCRRFGYHILDSLDERHRSTSVEIDAPGRSKPLARLRPCFCAARAFSPPLRSTLRSPPYSKSMRDGPYSTRRDTRGSFKAPSVTDRRGKSLVSPVFLVLCRTCDDLSGRGPKRGLYLDCRGWGLLPQKCALHFSPDATDVEVTYWGATPSPPLSFV